MSKYIEDIQGKILSNPINETNTKYPYIEKKNNIRDADVYPIDSQYIYNYNEPVSDIDTEYYDDYRNKIEELRKKTESTYEALESCLVPTEIPGMSFQPYEFQNIENENGEIEERKIKSLNYIFQDHLSPIGVDAKEYVFRTNKVKFIDDRHRRLIYNRTIHLMSSKEDEDNRVTFRDILYRTFFEYYEDKYYSLVKTAKNTAVTHFGDVIYGILNDIRKNNKTYIVIDEDGNEKKIESIKDFELPLQSGQDIDTLIPSTLYNLYNIGWVNPAMIFLNGLAIEWTKIIISVDNIDTFIIVSNLRESSSNLIDDDKEIFLDYIHIPFKVAYIYGPVLADNIDKKYVENHRLTKPVIFIINKISSTIIFDSLSTLDFQKDSITLNNTTNYSYDRIICLDDNIKYAEFNLDEINNKNLKDTGINYTKSFKEFCDNDYRCKLKQFNFLGFELDRYFDGDNNYRGTLKNDDFTITWHPFNIIDIRFKRLFNRRRVFKVFYNTKVLYDQDNILRIKNHDRLSEEYEKYRKDVTANIDTYLNEIYIMAKKDIGTYIVTNKESNMYGYKYHYVTPYECFLLYNAINIVLGKDTVSFDEFKDINLINTRNNPTVFKSQMNPNLTINEDSKCVWKIGLDDVQYPVVNIIETSSGITTLADVVFDEDNKELSIIMNSNKKDISEFVYKVTLYYPVYEYNNPDLEYVDNKCVWRIDNIYKADSAIVTVYEISTNQVVLTDVDIVNDSTINIIFKKTGFITRNKYKVVINAPKKDTRSFINYINGGFIAIPKDEDSIFAERIDEDDIYTNHTSLNNNIRQYISNIINKTNATVTDILIPIDNETRTDDTPVNNSFYVYEGDTRGKVIPFVPIMSEFGLKQEYDDIIYDVLKLRFELCYLNNMEEGATPVDEFIYYFDNENLQSLNTYPIVSNYKSRKTANILNALAKNVFKYDPNLVLESIEKMNYSADYIIPDKLSNNKRDDIIVVDSNVPISGYDYRYDPKFYYNYGYYDEDNIAHKLQCEWGLRRNLTEMFYFSLSKDEYTLDSMHLLDEVFDFTYDFDKSYEENLRHGLNYIIGYDADKLEQSIKRSVVSFSRTGLELKRHMISNPGENKNRLYMSRWNISKQDNYVIIFKNRELYSKYYTIEYTDTMFSVEFESNTKDDDIFEFVFFLNANNTILKKVCETEDDIKLTVLRSYLSKPNKNITVDDTIELTNVIACNTSIIDAENVQLLVDVMPSADGDKWNMSNTENTTYELTYNMKSYRATTNNYYEDKRFSYTLSDDNKINGLYRVTKQGGGEYFLEFDGKVPENPGTGTSKNPDLQEFEDGGYTTDRMITLPYVLYLSSKRQFRYKHFVVEEDSPAATIYVMTKKNYVEENVGKTYVYRTDDDDFKFCVQRSHILVFKNGLLLPNTYYYLHSIINNPVDDTGIVFNVPLNAGDTIDIFYVTNDLKHLECDYYDEEKKERYLQNGDIKLNSYNNEYRVMGEQLYSDNTDRTNYIKLRSPLYAISSKHSTFVFLNGKKVRTDELEDISDTIMSINTDYATEDRSMNAVRLEVINHLDTQDIIEQLYINDGLSHDDIYTNQFNSTNIKNIYKNTKLIKSIDLNELESYSERTLLDDMLNDLSTENLNKLFYNYDTSKGPMTPYDESKMNDPDFVNRDTIISSILSEYYISEDPDAYITTDTAEGNIGTVFYIGNKDKVKIPSSFDGNKTQSVFGTTFNNNSFIKKVIIPEGIESID